MKYKGFEVTGSGDRWYVTGPNFRQRFATEAQAKAYIDDGLRALFTPAADAPAATDDQGPKGGRDAMGR